MQYSHYPAVRNKARSLSMAVLSAAAFFSGTALADLEPRANSSAGASDAAPGSTTSHTPGPNDEKFKILRAKCEKDVGCGKASGDVCAEAAALVLLENDVPSSLFDVPTILRTRLALRLLERGVDSSNLAAAKAFDIYDKADLIGIRNAAMPDAFRAKELDELLTKRAYPGMALRKARTTVSIFSIASTPAERTQACQLATKLKAGAKLDSDSVQIADQVLASNYCESLNPKAPEPEKPRPAAY
jgi:hypothetical protein